MSPTLAAPRTTVAALTLLAVLIGGTGLVVGGAARSSPASAQPARSGDADPVPVERLAGTGRIDTALAASRAVWGRAGTVVVARADAFPDALAGGPLAAAADAPLLLTGRDALHPGVADEIERLRARRVVLLGAEAALSERVAAQARALGVAVERVGGRDRYATAAAVRAEAPLPREVVLASGTSFPDALAAGGLHPERVLLTGADRLAGPTAAVLDGADAVERITVAGGTAVVSDAAADVAGQGRDVVRLAGDERYATAAAITDAALARLGEEPRPLVVATGQNFPDALAAGPLASRLAAPIALVPSAGELPEATEAMLADHAGRFDRVVVLGGTAAVSGPTVDRVRAAVSAGRLPAPDVDLADCGEAGFPCAWGEADEATLVRAAELLDRSVASLRDGTAPEAVVAALEAEADMAGVLYDGAAITFRLDGGLPTVALTDRAAPGVAPAEAAQPTGPASTSAEQGADATIQSFDPAGPAGDPKRVLIVSPYDEAWAEAAATGGAAAFAAEPDEYSAVTVARGQQAGISTMESVPSYDIVNIISHGSTQGFAGRVASELFELDPDTGETRPTDDAEQLLPEGVILSGDVHDGPGERRLYFSWVYFELLYADGNQAGAGAADTIFFGAWCQSSRRSPYDIEGFPHLFTGTGATFLGWTDNVWVDLAGESLTRYWELMVEHGVEASLGHSMLAARDLTVDTQCDGGSCGPATARLQILEGDDHRARDVVETRVGDRPLQPGMDLAWDGDVDDGAVDALTDLAVLVEGVAHDRAGEGDFRLFLRGEGVPDDEIPVDWNLADDGTVVDAGEGHDDRLVTVDRVELPYDVTEDMVSPTPLELEVRVGDDERYSAQRIPDVRLPVGTVRAVHPDHLAELADGHPHPAAGTEGDGQPDETTVWLQVTDVDPDEVDQFQVRAEITADTLDAPVDVDEPLAAFDQVDERTYRHAEDIALDRDLTSQRRDLTVDAALVKDGADHATHRVTVELHADAPSNCWVERTVSGTWEDDDGTLVPISESRRWDAQSVGAAYDDDREHLQWLGLGPEGIGLGLVDIADHTGAIPLGQTGTFPVPYDPDAAGFHDPNAQHQRMWAVADDGEQGGEYEGPGTLVVTATDFGPDVFGTDQIHLMEADFSATLSQIGEVQNRPARGQVTIEGSFRYTREDGCIPLL